MKNERIDEGIVSSEDTLGDVLFSASLREFCNCFCAHKRIGCAFKSDSARESGLPARDPLAIGIIKPLFLISSNIGQV